MGKIAKIRAYFTTEVIIACTLAFVCSYLVFPNYFETNNFASQPGVTWASIDPSWMIALNYFNIKGFSWGNEVAFTYGPLGYLCIRTGWGLSRWELLSFDIFIFINYFSLFFIAFRRFANKWIAVVVILAVVFFHPFWIASAKALILFAFFVFWTRMSLDRPKPVYYVFQIIILTLAFFIKFNTGLIVFPIFFAGLIYNFVNHKKQRLVLAAYALLPIVLIFCLAPLLNVALGDYMRSGMQMISGYNDVMFLDIQLEGGLWYALLLIGILGTVFLANRWPSNWKATGFKSVVATFIFATTVFVLYKQSFVRADLGHLNEFFIFMPLIALCTPDLYLFRNKIVTSIFLVSFLIPFYVLFIKQDTGFDMKYKFVKTEYFKRCADFHPLAGMFLFDNYTPLPQSVLQKIGTATVDVYPWNLEMLFANKLNYVPRPVCQSYIAYTPALEELNFTHYNSSKAPEFVIYDFTSIDSRYPLFDEPKVNLALFKNYTIAEVFEMQGIKLALLQKKPDFRPVKLTKTDEYAMMLGGAFSPKPDVYYEIEVYDSFVGKINSLLRHAPELQIEIGFDGRPKAWYRTSKGLLKSGVFCESYFNTTQDFVDFYTNGQTSSKVKYYNIIAPHPSQFKEKVRITEYRITQ